MLINEVLNKEQFYHDYQPIFNIKNPTKIGYESLIRSEHYRSPEVMFNVARKEKRLYELDSRSIHKAIQTYSKTNEKGNLFINILPSTIANPNFPSLINKIINDNTCISQQVIFEVNEAEDFLEMKEFKKGIKELKEKKFSIALDDVGKGYGDLIAIIEIEPNYVKLDRFFSQSLHSSKKKQSIVEGLVKYCKDYDSTLILEGIETEEEMTAAKELGVSYAQGYYLGRPGCL